MKKDAYYFSHDSKARKEWSIVKMRMYYGWSGYGIYWALIELASKKHYTTEDEIKDFFSISDLSTILDLTSNNNLFYWEDDKCYPLEVGFRWRRKPFLGNIRLSDLDFPLWRKICQKVFKRDEYKCAYCGSIGGKLEVDHIIPFSRGGSEDMDNLTTSCQKCNRKKQDKTPEEFEIWQEARN